MSDKSELLANTKTFSEAVATAHKKLSKSVKTIKDTPLETMTPALVVKWLEHLGSSKENQGELSIVVPDALLLGWQHAERQDVMTLEADIRDACAERGWRLDGEWPDLYVECGVHIAVDEKTQVGQVGTRKMRGVTWRDIIGALEPQLGELVPSGFDSLAFLNLLERAYDSLGEHRERQRPIREVYEATVIASQSTLFRRNATSAHFKELSVDQFRARMSRVMYEGQTVTGKGCELRFFPPLDVADALFVYQPAEDRFGYVGRVEFVPIRRHDR